jgi:hypothetical protein
MVLKEEKIEELKLAAEPLVKWLNENCHPHVVVIVDSGGAELLEGVAKVKIEQFIKD